MDKAFLSGFASALTEMVFGKLSDVFILELKNILLADEFLIKLESTTKKGRNLFNSEYIFHLDDTIQADLPSKLEELAKICYDAEDIIDDITLDIVNHNLGSSAKPVLRNILRSPKRLGKPQGIKKLLMKLDSIIDDVQDLFKNSSQSERQTSLCCLDQKLSMFFVGREMDIEDIVQRLISNDNEFNGVSILGMTGLGKTELALAILQDKQISKQYCISLLVHSLGGSFNLKEAIDLFDVRFGNNGFIKEQIQNVLIVIDNLLDISLNDWDKFWTHVKSKGTINMKIKILVTTLNPEVSQTTGTFPYFLKPFPNENCKKVIVSKALLHNQILSEIFLSNLADSLAKKCEGLPIVASILGVVLARCSQNKRAIMLKEDLWDLPEFKKEVVPILKSSYLNMHPQMKQCVVYFTLFPDGYYFNIHKLINLWAGEGFLQQHQATTTFDEIGSYYISCLRGRSILQESKDANNDEEKVYELHKFTRKILQLAASKIFVRFENDMRTSSLCRKYVRHLFLLCDNMERNTWVEIQKMKRLRTLLAPHCKNFGQIPGSLFTTLTRVRVLVLNETDIIELPNSICGLKFLRFLDISFTSLKTLPKHFSEISSLEFLNLHDTNQLLSLPSNFCNLTNLVCLDWKMSDIIRFRHQPSHISKLLKLQTLPLFIVKNEVGFCIGELKDVDHLQGSLCIRNLENVRDKAEAEEALLHNKLCLEMIELEWTESSNDAAAKEVLEGLKPHCYLKELKITNYGGRLFPDWICHQCQMFETIHIKRCQKCCILPPLGALQNLKNLFIEQLSDLQFIDRGFCGPPSLTGVGCFPKLESLSFKDMPQFSEWTGLEAIDLPCLRSLKVQNCSQLVYLPSLEYFISLVELEIVSCPKIASLPKLPTSIKLLKIKNSNLLRERCAIGGADWLKVDCVDKVEIDNLEIQTSGTSAHRQ